MLKLAILSLLLALHVASGHHPDSGFVKLGVQSILRLPPQEVVLLAGGSLSTVMKVYHYNLDDKHPLGFSNMRLYHSSPPMSIGPCYSQLFVNCGTLEELITFAKNHTTRPFGAIEMIMLGDGGTRNIRSQDSRDFISKLTTALKNTNLNPFKLSVSRIMSGEEEAASSWVALNYLQGFFDSQTLTNNVTGTGDVTDTYDVKTSSGVVDVSLESAQVAFQCSPQAGSYPVTLGNTRYTLYTHSYMGFGVHGLARLMAEANADNIHDGTENSTVTNKDNTTSVLRTWNNPCYLKGDNTTFTQQEGRLTSPKNYTNQNEERIMHVGTGEPEECFNLTMEQLNVTPDTCSLEPCAIGNVYQPTLMPDMPIYAINNIAATVQNIMRLRTEEEVFDMSVLWETSYYLYCGLTKDEAVQMGVAPEVASSRCLTGMFGPELLYRLGVPEQDANIYIATNIDEQPVDWELGAMVLNTHEMIANERRDACASTT